MKSYRMITDLLIEIRNVCNASAAHCAGQDRHLLARMNRLAYIADDAHASMTDGFTVEKALELAIKGYERSLLSL